MRIQKELKGISGRIIRNATVSFFSVVQCSRPCVILGSRGGGGYGLPGV